jgi:anti-anti-sigma factor
MTLCNSKETLDDTSIQLNELVKGQDQPLLARIEPLVAQQSVELDLSPVERIDAAGIAALVTLYATACQAGHTFTISNVSPRVMRILALVGLDRILLSQNAVRNSYSGPQLQRSAA